jgi:hypothetical protein
MSYRTIGLPGLILVLLILFLSACAPVPQRVHYEVGDTRTLAGGPLSNYNLLVRPLEDQRDPDLVGRKSRGGETAMSEDGKFYVNADDAYEDAPVATAVTRMMAQHVAASGLFKTVFVTATEANQSDLVLTGKLKRFEARREAHQVQEAMANGLIGIILTSTKVWAARYEANTELSELRLIEPQSQAIIWQGDVQGHTAGEDNVQGVNWVVYQEANLSLKDAVDKLLEQLAAVKPPRTEAGAADHAAVP